MAKGLSVAKERFSGLRRSTLGSLPPAAQFPNGLGRKSAASEGNSVIPSIVGGRVVRIFAEVTDAKNLPNAQCQRLHMLHAPVASGPAKLIELANKTSNPRALVNSPPADWPMSRKQEYVRWADAVVAGSRGANPWLEARFDEAVAAF